MFCVKCGKELSNNEQFCPECGTKTGAKESSSGINISTDNVKENALKLKDNFLSAYADLGNNKFLLLAEIVMLLLNMIFCGTTMFIIEAPLGSGESSSLFEMAEEIIAGSTTFIVIGYILSAVCILLPVLLKKAWKAIYFLPSKIINIFMAAIYSFSLFACIHGVNTHEYSEYIEFSLSATAWFFMMLSVAAIFFAFKLPKILCKATAVTAQDEVKTE